MYKLFALASQCPTPTPAPAKGAGVIPTVSENPLTERTPVHPARVPSTAWMQLGSSGGGRGSELVSKTQGQHHPDPQRPESWVPHFPQLLPFLPSGTFHRNLSFGSATLELSPMSPVLLGG